VFRNVLNLDDLDEVPGGDVAIGDEVAVTGFGGCVWWTGRVVAESREKRASREYTIVFSGDGTKVKTMLKRNRYGAATVTKRGGKVEAKLGWYILGNLDPVSVKGGGMLDQ
jgi:hypothetical protein